jgi:hypothetical protein
LIPTIVGIATLLLTAAEGAYREWDRWAPHDTPQVDIERSDWTGSVGITITNRDPADTFKLTVTDVTGPQGRLRWGPDDLWPWPMSVGQDSGERRIERGESVRVLLLVFNPNAPRSFDFRGVARNYRLPAFTPAGDALQTDIAVHIRLFRVGAGGWIDHTERLSWRDDY